MMIISHYLNNAICFCMQRTNSNHMILKQREKNAVYAANLTMNVNSTQS